MDLLQAVLQPSVNEEIQALFKKYMKFFQKAALKVRDNVGEEVNAERLIQKPCGSCLKQAKLLFSDGEIIIPRLTHELPGIKCDEQAEEECAHWESPIPKKRKRWPPGHILSNDRAATGMVWVGTNRAKGSGEEVGLEEETRVLHLEESDPSEVTTEKGYPGLMGRERSQRGGGGFILFVPQSS